MFCSLQGRKSQCPSESGSMVVRVDSRSLSGGTADGRSWLCVLSNRTNNTYHLIQQLIATKIHRTSSSWNIVLIWCKVSSSAVCLFMSSNTFSPLLAHRSHAFFTFVYRSCWCFIFSPWWDWRVLSFVDKRVLNRNILTELFFKVLHCPLMDIQVALPA